jgi:predicted HicB family RNase H-like nuclease
MTHLQPSVDLSFPTPVHGRIPSFNTIEEETAFWDTHSVTEFDEELTSVEVTVSKNLSAPLSVRLDPKDRAAIVRQAQAKGVGPSTLIRMWVKEYLRQDAEAESGTR